MAFNPISGHAIQFQKNADGTSASDFFIKLFASGTTTPILFATDSTGGTLLAKARLNSDGYVTTEGSPGSIFTIHTDQTYKISLFPTETDADNNTSAIWTIDGLKAIGADVGQDLVDFIAELADQTDPVKGSFLVGHLLGAIHNVTSFGWTVFESINHIFDRKVDVTDPRYGATGDGTTNDSAGLVAGDGSGQQYDIPEHTYLFTAENLVNIGNSGDITGVNIKNDIADNVVQTDRDVNWLQHNHLEESFIGTTEQAITSGDIPPPPIYTGGKQDHTNVLVSWYQDFGLEATRAASGAIGSLQWYYWSWLFRGAAGEGYEPERQPTLGYYRGDDPNVLDWQAYWLNEAGATGCILQTRGGATQYGSIRSTWESDTDVNHWMFQLLTNAPNFLQQTYALWAYSQSFVNDLGNQEDIEDSFTEIVEIYNTHDNFNFISKNGGVYPVVFVFEGEAWRAAYDNSIGDTDTKTFLIAQAAKFKAKGWQGFCLLARNSTFTLVGDQDLEEAGVIYLDAEYSSSNYTPSLNGGLATAVDYNDLAIGAGTRPDTSTLPYESTVPNAVTSHFTHVGSGHTSTFSEDGSTPELFEVMMRNILKRGMTNGNPRIITVYNVSEWAEAGPSLQPNMRDGKGYITAMKNALASFTPDIAPDRAYKAQTPTFVSGVNATLDVNQDVTTVPITVSFGFTSAATPFIGEVHMYDGRRIRLIRRTTAAVSNAGTLILQDEGTLTGSGLKLESNTISLSPNDSIELEWNEEDSILVQVGPLVVPV